MVSSKPPIQRRLGLPSPLVNRQQLEADHSLPFNVEIKSEWDCTSTFPFAVFEETLVGMNSEILLHTVCGRMYSRKVLDIVQREEFIGISRKYDTVLAEWRCLTRVDIEKLRAGIAGT